MENIRLSLRAYVPNHEAHFIAKQFYDSTPTLEAYKKCIKIAKKRKRGVPLQYLLGDQPFCDISVRCNKNVLIPRQETEYLADMIIRTESAKKSFLDMCAGSGCIGLAIKKALGADVTLSDISAKALKEIKINAQANDLDVNIVKSDMFKNIKSKYDVIVINPPYLTHKDMLNLDKDVKKEPKLALYGGKDGLDYYRIIAGNAKQYLLDGGKLYLEIGKGQHKDVLKLFEDYTSAKAIKDLHGIYRYVVVNK